MNNKSINFSISDIEKYPVPLMIKSFGLDAPVVGGVFSAAFPVSGWIVPQPPFIITSMELVSNETLLKNTLLNISRPDAAQYFDIQEPAESRFGFITSLGTLGLSKTSRIDLVAKAYNPEDQSYHKAVFATLVGSMKSNITTITKYQPIMLTAIGRSGTTLLMQMLSGHPEILTSNFYPYEVKQSSYWMHLLKILADPADFTNSTHPDGFERNFGFIGHNPYSHQESVRQFKTPGAYEELYNAKYPADIIDFCTSRIDDFYEVVEKDENKQGARLFAEKFIPSHIQFLLADIYTSPKEIILTRDFRDVICSARSFNQKRNDQGFGRNRASDEKDWVRRVFASGARNLVRAWEARKDNALHVRYEDLVKSTESELKRIFNYLEIDCSPLLLKSIASKTMHTATSSDHRTSNSAEQSIERWRTDLPEDLLSYCNESLRSELEVFGYEQQ